MIGVGLGSGVKVVVGGGGGVLVAVEVAVAVAVEVSVGGIITSGVWRRAKNTRIAPIARNSANNPMAAGRLSVTAGIRLPCTAFVGCEGFSVLPSSEPHTRHLVASSLRRVPQVGHNLDGFVSGLIGLFLKVFPSLADYTR